MSMKKFVEITRKKPIRKFREADRIPGTDKVRTYAWNAELYSEESSLEKIKARNTPKRHK